MKNLSYWQGRVPIIDVSRGYSMAAGPEWDGVRNEWDFAKNTSFTTGQTWESITPEQVIEDFEKVASAPLSQEPVNANLARVTETENGRVTKVSKSFYEVASFNPGVLRKTTELDLKCKCKGLCFCLVERNRKGENQNANAPTNRTDNS